MRAKGAQCVFICKWRLTRRTIFVQRDVVDHRHTRTNVPCHVGRQVGLLEERIRQMHKDSGSSGERGASSIPGQLERHRSSMQDVEPIRGLPEGVHGRLLHAATEEAVQQGGGESHRERPPDVHATRLSER